MPKEILFYGGVNDFSSMFFMEKFEEAIDEKEVMIRVNTDGGDPQSMFGLINKFQEFNGVTTVRGDGKVLSAGLYFMAYADKTEALDVSDFLIHRAAYPEYVERDLDLFTETDKKRLKALNDSLKKAFKSRVNPVVFKEITGHTLDSIFSMDSRIDVSFTAKDAKKMGLVDKIIPITPKIRSSVESGAMGIAAKFTEGLDKNKPESKNKHKMTLEELKTENPEVYAEAIKRGGEIEKDRVLTWMAFADVDPEGVKKAIKGDEEMSRSTQAELSRKAFSADALKADADSNADDLETSSDDEEDGLSADQKKEKSFIAEVKKNLKGGADE